LFKSFFRKEEEAGLFKSFKEAALGEEEAGSFPRSIPGGQRVEEREEKEAGLFPSFSRQFV
jgi:hypothetical protein